MSETVIRVENLSKQYRLGEMGTGTISHDLNRWWHKIRGKEDPYLKIGEANDRATKGTSEYVWALRDINFNVKQGEVLGIIGKNGAGKSTLLKILSRVTVPTTGSVKAKGRIASLLEVGTGFHEELTGKENVFLNGAIMGMSKSEIRSKFDEIVAFSGTERYIDTPVKRYSSGMRVRLAFAVAAHLEPEILIVDEVLAVGDIEFQKKAIGKMQDISKGEGRTVLFVSHNMGAVQSLCTKGIILVNGQLSKSGDISDVINEYLSLQTFKSDLAIKDSLNHLSSDLSINSITINGSPECELTLFDNIFKINIEGSSRKSINIAFEASLSDEFGKIITYYAPYFSNGVKKTLEGDFNINEELVLPTLLNRGSYYLNLYLTLPGYEYYLKIENKILISIEGTPTFAGQTFQSKHKGFFMINPPSASI